MAPVFEDDVDVNVNVKIFHGEGQPTKGVSPT